MKIVFALMLWFTCIQVYACNGNIEGERVRKSNNIANSDTMRLKIIIGSKIFTATLDNNETVTAFKAKLPITIKMKELNGNEKYYDLSDDMPSNPSNPGTIQTGDLKLYGSNVLVLFYKTFSTSYSYTTLGRVNDPSGLATSLGSGSVTVRLELEK